jgi:hypothetical protein
MGTSYADSIVSPCWVLISLVGTRGKKGARMRVHCREALVKPEAAIAQLIDDGYNTRWLHTSLGCVPSPGM